MRGPARFASPWFLLALLGFLAVAAKVVQQKLSVAVTPVQTHVDGAGGFDAEYVFSSYAPTGFVSERFVRDLGNGLSAELKVYVSPKLWRETAPGVYEGVRAVGVTYLLRVGEVLLSKGSRLQLMDALGRESLDFGPSTLDLSLVPELAASASNLVFGGGPLPLSPEPILPLERVVYGTLAIRGPQKSWGEVVDGDLALILTAQ